MKFKVEIYNRYTYFTGAFAKHKKLLNYFRFHPDKYQFMPMYRNVRPDGTRMWDGYITLFNRRWNRVSSGLFIALKEKIEEETGVRFIIRDRRETLTYAYTALSDRYYQNDCVHAMQAEKTGGLVISPTASGKTLVAGLYLSSLEGTACFIVDELTLMDQAVKSLSKTMGEEIGEIGDGWFTPKRITVATIQTLFLHRKNPKFKDWQQGLDVVIIDEVHLALNRRNVEVIKNMLPSLVFGLTATLETWKPSVQLSAFSLCGPVIFEYTQKLATEEGYLAKAVVCAVKVSQLGTGSDDYHSDYRDLIVESTVRNKAILSLAKEAYRRGKYTIIIVERVAHIKLLSRLLRSIPHRTVYGEKKLIDRVKSKRKLHRGDIKLLIVNKVFKKGVDIPTIDCIIECAGYKSKNDAIQKFGRGKRLAPKKRGLLYFDINDRTFSGAEERNRFERASRSRLKAFRSKGVPITYTRWMGNAEEIFIHAENKLSEIIG